MALEQAIKDALLKAKDNPADLKEIFESIGVNITIPKAPAPDAGKDEIKKWFEDLKTTITNRQKSESTEKVETPAEIKALSDKMTTIEAALGKMAERFENSDKALQEELKSKRAKEVTDYLAEMEKDGRLAPKDDAKKTLYQNLLEKDFEAQKQVFDTMPKNKSVAPIQTPTPPVVSAGIVDRRTEHEKVVEAAKAQIKSLTS